MKTYPMPYSLGRCRSFLAAGLSLLPALAFAHPGHYHPGEEDEFDAMRASFLHVHGTLEIGLVCVAVAAAIVFMMNRNRPARIAAAITAVGAIAVLGIS